VRREKRGWKARSLAVRVCFEATAHSFLAIIEYVVVGNVPTPASFLPGRAGLRCVKIRWNLAEAGSAPFLAADVVAFPPGGRHYA
jgi:hypothetical protein